MKKLMLISAVMFVIVVLVNVFSVKRDNHKPAMPAQQSSFSCLSPATAIANEGSNARQQACVACHTSSVSPIVRKAAPAKAREKAVVVVVTSKRHTVKPGECLWAIAEHYGLGGENWSKIHRANPQVSDPNLIHPGQVLVIPVASTTAVSVNVKASSSHSAKKAQSQQSGAAVIKTTAGVFLWTVAGGNPFGKRNHRQALSQLPTNDLELVNALLKQYNTVQPKLEAQHIKPGTDFDWILFGNYHWVHTARWSGKSDLDAYVWPEFEYKGRLWTITLTPLCNNLEISSRVPPPAPPVVQPPPKEEPPPPPAPPVVQPPPKEEPPPPPAPPATERPCCKWEPEYKGSLFMAPRWGVNYPNKDHQMIYGGELDVFPGYCGSEDRKFVPGASIKGVGWDGQFGEKNGGLLKFNGNQIVYGGVAELRQRNDLTILHARYGEQEGKAWNNTGYMGEEENELVNVELRHLHKTGHNWPSEVQGAFGANIDVGGTKKSSVNGIPLTAAQDPRRDQSQFAIMGQASLYASDTVEPLVGMVVDHTPGAKITGVEPYVGAKVFEEQLEPSARYRVNIGKDNPSDTFGANLVWNFDRTLNKAAAYLRNKWANRGVEEAQAEPLPSTPTQTIVPAPVTPERP